MTTSTVTGTTGNDHIFGDGIDVYQGSVGSAVTVNLTSDSQTILGLDGFDEIYGDGRYEYGSISTSSGVVSLTLDASAGDEIYGGDLDDRIVGDFGIAGFVVFNGDLSASITNGADSIYGGIEMTGLPATPPTISLVLRTFPVRFLLPMSAEPTKSTAASAMTPFMVAVPQT